MEANLHHPEYTVKIFDHPWLKNSLKYTSKILKKSKFDLWWGIKEANLKTGVYYIATQARRKGVEHWQTSASGHHRLEVFLNSTRKFKPCEKPKLLLAQPSTFPELLLCTRGLGVWSDVPKKIRRYGNGSLVSSSGIYEVKFEGRPGYAIDELSLLSEEGVAAYKVLK